MALRNALSEKIDDIDSRVFPLYNDPHGIDTPMHRETEIHIIVIGVHQ